MPGWSVVARVVILYAYIIRSSTVQLREEEAEPFPFLYWAQIANAPSKASPSPSSLEIRGLAITRQNYQLRCKSARKQTIQWFALIVGDQRLSYDSTKLPVAVQIREETNCQMLIKITSKSQLVTIRHYLCELISLRYFDKHEDLELRPATKQEFESI